MNNKYPEIEEMTEDELNELINEDLMGIDFETMETLDNLKVEEGLYIPEIDEQPEEKIEVLQWGDTNASGNKHRKSEDVVSGNVSDNLQKIQDIVSSAKPMEKVMIAFQQNAGKYWGKVLGAKVTQSRKASSGTVYYIVIASIIKSGTKLKLIQEWYVSKDGEAKPTKAVTFDDDMSDEIGLMVME